jgi:hypothetical protein
MNYIDETLKFIESDEMREHLRNKHTYRGEQFLSRSDCAMIVSNAPASVERKIPVLDLIAAQTEPDSESREYSNHLDPVWLANFARRAIGEEQKSQTGTVFQVHEFICNVPGYYSDCTLYHEFDAAIRYINRIDEKYGNVDDTANYKIKKFIYGDNGKMVEKFFWIINSSGEIWYFGEVRDKCVPPWESFFDPIGSINLPVPFVPGDIVTADCRPFAEKRRVLITEIGSDCCGVQCMYFSSDKKLCINAFKHNSFLSRGEESSYVSVLYRAARYHGVLDDFEEPFGAISVALKATPKLGERFYDYVHKKNNGASWEELKNEFGL